jgi:hypothetical protein
MKRQLLREFIREALLEGSGSMISDDVPQVDDNAQGTDTSMSNEDQPPSWEDIIIKSGIKLDEYNSAVNGFITRNSDKISAAADSFHSLRGDPEALRLLIGEAVNLDLKYSGSGDKIFPLAVVRVCALVDGSWDNVFQLVAKLIEYLVTAGLSFAGSLLSSAYHSLFGEAKQLNGQLNEWSMLASGVVFGVMTPLYFASALWDRLLPSWVGAKNATNFKAALKEVLEGSANALDSVAAYFRDWSEEKDLAEHLTSLAQLLRTTSDTRAKLVEIKAACQPKAARVR